MFKSSSKMDLPQDSTESFENVSLEDATEELTRLRKKIESADTEKSRLLLEKLDSEGAKKKAQNETIALTQSEDNLTANFNQSVARVQMEISDLEKANQDLMKKFQMCQEKLNAKKAETDTLKEKSKIKAVIPKKTVKFTEVEKGEREDESENIEAIFTIIQRPKCLVNGKEAIVTFEEEKVAEQILKLAKCTVPCDNSKINVKPCSLPLESSVKFEIHIKVSKKMIAFANAPTTLPEDRMKDRLEICFSKPSRGGAEVEKVDYDVHTGSGFITFLNTGVAETLALQRKYCLDASGETLVDVSPLYTSHLKKFQTFVGVPKRTVLLGSIQDVVDEEDVQDHLEIHFQKPSNYGGEVEAIKYVSTGQKLTAFFSEDCPKMENEEPACV